MKFSQSTYYGKALVTMIVLIMIMLPVLMAQQKPSDYFGFQPGSDGNLFTYEELISYLQKLDEASDKLKMVEIGHSPEGRQMYIAFISSADNLNNLDRLKVINKRLALDTDIPSRKRKS